jgi:hypothetical protein
MLPYGSSKEFRRGHVDMELIVLIIVNFLLFEVEEYAYLFTPGRLNEKHFTYCLHLPSLPTQLDLQKQTDRSFETR